MGHSGPQWASGDPKGPKNCLGARQQYICLVTYQTLSFGTEHDNLTEKIHHISVNACLAPVCSMHGMAVTTVEGMYFL